MKKGTGIRDRIPVPLRAAPLYCVCEAGGGVLDFL